MCDAGGGWWTEPRWVALAPQARAASAKTSKQITEMVGSLNTSNAVVAFEKMEEKVRGRRGGAAASSTGHLVSLVVFSCAAALYSSYYYLVLPCVSVLRLHLSVTAGDGNGGRGGEHAVAGWGLQA